MVKIVAMTDLHGETSRNERLAKDLAAADVVLIAGDITHFGRREAALRVLDAIRAGCLPVRAAALARTGGRILAVPGNCDRAEVGELLEDEGASIHARHVTIDGVTFLGAGMSLPCPGGTPGETTEEGLAESLELASAGIEAAGPRIVVTHQPPRNTLLDVVSDGSHVGSSSVRDFLERMQPVLCLTGHIHEARGVDLVGRTEVVNPGPQRHGFYAIAEIEGDGAKVDLRRAWSG